MRERFPIFWLSLIAAATVGLVVSCDRVPLTSPTGSTISLSIDKNILPLNGQATVKAVVIESAGTPVHNGTLVTFQPSIGSTNPVEAETVNGVATVTFLSGSVSGTGVIHAFSGGARTGAGNSSAGGVEVKIGAAAAGGMSVSATPPSVSQSGGTVTISALVMDPSNNPLPGVSVLFSTSTGALASTTALSDSNGIARTTLTTSQTATVTAVAGAARGEVQVVVSAAPDITVNAPDGTVGIPVAITVTRPAATGNVSPRQIQTLTVDYGDGSVDTRTNVTGTSIGFTHTYRNAGGYIVTARAVDVDGNTSVASDSTTIAFAALPTATISAVQPTTPAPVTVTFTVSGAAATTTGGAPITSMRAFINGEQVFASTSGASQTFAHRFTAGGNYVATVVVTDAAGNEGRSQTTVVVQ